MRHLRVLAFLLIFCLLPATLAGVTLTAWIGDEKEARRVAFTTQVERRLADARDRILSGTTLQELAEAIVGEIEKRREFVGGAVQEILAGWESRYPGVLDYQAYLVSVKKGTLPWVTARGVPLANNIGGKDRFVYQQLAEYLMTYRLWLERDRAVANDAPPPRMQPGRETIVREAILGSRRSVAWVADRYRDVLDVTRRGKPSRLYWDFVYDVEDATGTRIPIGLVILTIDPAAFREQFRPERVIARCQAEAGLPGLELGLFEGSATTGTAAVREAAARASAVGAVGAADTENFWTFLRLSGAEGARGGGQPATPTGDAIAGGGTGTVLYARIARSACHPDLDRLERLVRAALAAFVLVFLAVGVPAQYGRIRIFLSLRYQVTALFLLVSLLPIAAFLYGGARYLRASRDNIREETYDRLRERVRGADESARAAIDAAQRGALTLLADPAVAALAEDTGAVAFPVRLAAAGERLRSARAAGAFREAWLFDASGAVGWTTAAGDEFEGRLLGALARRVLRYANTGAAGPAETGAPPDPRADPIERLLAGERVAARDDVVRKRGVLHRFRLLAWDLYLLVEPLPGADGRAERALALAFDLRPLFRDVLDRFIATGAAGGAGDGVRLVRWPRPPFEDRGAEAWFQTRPEARELARRVARGVDGEGAEIAVDGRPMLAYAAPLRTMDEWGLLALSPADRLESEIARRRAYFLAVALLSLLVAGMASWGLSRRILGPLRLVQQGVRAVADGAFDTRMNLRSHDELGELSTTFNRMAAGLEEKERLARYVSESVLDEVKREVAGVGAQLVKATVLFTDIIDFTGLAERHPPGDIVEMLNEYLGRMSRVVRENGGVVDKFIGDSVMAVYYPDTRPGARSDESRAVVTALRMRAALSEFNRERRGRGQFEIDSGIGVNTGDLIRGSIGAAEHRVDLTVIGDDVNLAARLESVSREGRHTKIYLSERTWLAVRDLVETEPVERTRVKGKTEDIRIHEVVGLRKAADYLPWLASPDADRRLQGLRLLAVIGDPACLGPIRERLADDVPAVRGEAAWVTAGFGADPGSVRALSEALPREADPVTRASFVQVIGRIGDDEARIALRRLLDDPDLRVQANAIEAIGAAREPARVVPTLRDFARHPNNRIRANACVTLWSLGDTESLEGLLAMTRQPEPLMRASGAWGVGEVCSPDRMAALIGRVPDPTQLASAAFLARLEAALDRLLELLADGHPMVVRNAARALGRMGNRRAAAALVAAFQATGDDDLRGAILGALDEVGSFHVVRQLRETMRG